MEKIKFLPVKDHVSVKQYSITVFVRKEKCTMHVCRTDSELIPAIPRKSWPNNCAVDASVIGKS